MADTPFHFFKVILLSTLQDKKLEIPKKFVKKFGNELSTVATLTVPNGRVWKVELMKDGRKFWFRDGWNDFVQYHSITTGYFLVFRYGKHSNFHVLIFDMSACEIQYPYYCFGQKNDSKKSTLHQNAIEDEDSVEIIGSLTPKPPAFDSAFECGKSTTSLESPKLKCGYEVRSKRCKMEEVVEIDKSDSTSDESELNKVAYKVGKHSSDEANKRTKFDGQELLDILEEMGISVKMNFRNIATQEKERAMAAARLFRPKNPSFMIILRPSNICKGVYVPSQFTKKHLIGRDAEFIKLQDHDGREWCVKLGLYSSRLGYSSCDITHGWTTFSKERNLKNGDICIFELIGEKKNIVLKVSVFHSSTAIL
ncbi:hypothetical protein ACOSP7_005392 [Xanthoceras sorbifolium]